MRGSGRFKRLFRLQSRKGWVEDSVDLEMRHHVEMRVDEMIEEGVGPEEARRIARDAFGDMGHYRSECVALQRRGERMMRWMEWVGSMMSDVAHAFRSHV